MKIIINYIFTDEEIADAIYKVTHKEEITSSDIQALVYGSQQWILLNKKYESDLESGYDLTAGCFRF